MEKKELTPLQEENIVHIGTRIAEINREKTRLTIEGKKLNRELANILAANRLKRVKRDGLTVQVRSTYIGIDLEYLKTLDGFKKARMYRELPCDPHVVVTLRKKK